MQNYIVIAHMSARFHQGAVLGELSKDQLRRRAHTLEAGEKKGTWRVRDGCVCTFKRGEEVAVEGEINKSLLAVLAEQGSPAAKTAAGAKPRKKTKPPPEPKGEAGEAGDGSGPKGEAGEAGDGSGPKGDADEAAAAGPPALV